MITTGEDARRRVYDHPSSRARRAEAQTDQRADPVGRVKIKQLDERRALADKHRTASAKLNRDQEVRRAKDRMIGNGAAPSPQWLHRERAERDELIRAHRDEAQALAHRHRDELATAVKRNPTK